MECPHRLGLARVDPLMSPGVPAQHAHAIYGSNGMSFLASTASMTFSSEVYTRAPLYPTVKLILGYRIWCFFPFRSAGGRRLYLLPCHPGQVGLLAPPALL
jgi:hypothetical protein